MNLTPIWVAALVTGGCMTTADELGESTLAINGDNASYANQFQLDRALALFTPLAVPTPEGTIAFCTATRISARWAVTAAHCNPKTSSASGPSRVQFYDTGPGSQPSYINAQVVDVQLRPGVSSAACNGDYDACSDQHGLFADIALIKLRANDNLSEAWLQGPHATLAWEYPGAGVVGKKVGAGAHNGYSNPNRTLLQIPDELTSSNDEDGQFHTEDDDTDGGDSGGPFYAGSKIVGVLWGSWGLTNLYTSIPPHLNWILINIGYFWRGQPPQQNTVYWGTHVNTFVGTELECQYACEHTSNCEGYNFLSSNGSCGLYTNITHATTQSSWRGALKFGARSGNSNEVVGYVRSDGKNVVVHVDNSDRLHELWLSSDGWKYNDIHGSSPPVASQLTAYRRADRVDAIVYRSDDNRIIERARTTTGWTTNDLTKVANAPDAIGNPVAYVRADGIDAVVYRAETTGHIIELRRGSAGWLARDLSADVGSDLFASSNPSVSVRADGYNSVTFRVGSVIYELFQRENAPWALGSPSANAGAPAATGRPYGYSHDDGRYAIVYRTSSHQVIEMYLDYDDTWKWAQIGSGATGDPIGYVRPDGYESVVYRAGIDIVELTNPPWAQWNLSGETSAPAIGSNVSVYHRTDGYVSVLAETSANHVIELYLKRGDSWGEADLSDVVNEVL